jgi:uncharacterized phage protein (TIGR02218 family)
MTRTLTAGMISHVAGTAHTRARMLRLDLVDGTTLAITDHDKNLIFDLGDGSETYLASTGMSVSDVQQSTGFDADDFEVTGPVTDTGLTTKTALLGGRFDGAVARLFQVNWANLADGAIEIQNGTVALATVRGGSFKLTVHSEIGKFQQTLGDVTTLQCRYDFGTAPCPAVPVSVTATVSAVTDERSFSVTYAGTYASDYFNKGTVQFTSGTLAGTRKVEVYDFTSGGAGAGSLVLWTGLVEAPDIGDVLTLRQGCYDLASNQSKSRVACVALLGSAVDFGGEPDLPGQDKMLTYPSGGAA